MFEPPRPMGPVRAPPLVGMVVAHVYKAHEIQGGPNLKEVGLA